MQLEIISDKQQLAAYLTKYAHLNYYHLGDLDDFYWPNTTWYCAVEDGDIQAVSLLYQNFDGPIILAILNENEPQMRWLLEQVLPLLPEQIYAHLSPGLQDIFSACYTLEDHGPHFEMVLRAKRRAISIDTSQTSRIGPEQEADALRLFEDAYPGNWFNPRMLDTGMYYGWYDPDGILRSIAGVHVYAPEYHIAAVGNVTTDPEFRGRGLGTMVTARLCQELLQAGISTIGLNVRQDNPAALRSYRKLGFEMVGEYHEMMLKST